MKVNHPTSQKTKGFFVGDKLYTELVLTVFTYPKGSLVHLYISVCTMTGVRKTVLIY